MLNWRNFSNLQVFKTLRLKKGAVINVENADGTVTEVAGSSLGGGLILTGGSNLVLTAGQSGSTIVFDNAGFTSVTLPAVAAGLNFKVICGITPTVLFTVVNIEATTTMQGNIASSEDAAGSTNCTSDALAVCKTE